MILRIAPRPTPEEELETWELHVKQLIENKAKAEKEVARIERKLISAPGDKVYVELLDEAERWLKRATHDLNGHQRVLNDLRAKAAQRE